MRRSCWQANGALGRPGEGVRAGWAAGSPGERLRRAVKGHLRKWQFVVSYELISLTALVFRAPRPPVALNGSAPTAWRSRDTQPKARSAHWLGWEAKRAPDLGPLRVFVCLGSRCLQGFAPKCRAWCPAVAMSREEAAG